MKIVQLIVFLSCWWSVAALADPTVSASVSPAQMEGGESVELQVHVRDLESEKLVSVELAPSDEFLFEEIGRTQSLTLLNGTPTTATTVVFRVFPKKAPLSPGPHRLPDGKVKLTRQTIPFQGPSITVGAAAVAKESPIDFLQVVGNDEPYVGEQVLYRCEILTKGEIANPVLEETTLEGFFRESFDKEKQTVRRIAGSSARVFSIREAVYPNREGTLEIPPRGLGAKIRTKGRQSSFGSDDLFSDIWSGVFDEFSFKPARFVAPAVSVKVKPLPPKPSWAKGYVPVGKTTLEAQLDRRSVGRGESAQLTVVIRSEGNLRPLEFELSLPRELKSYPEKPLIEVTSEGDTLIQTKVFRFNIVPESGGEYSLPTLEVPVFHPDTGEYARVSSSPGTLTVVGEVSELPPLDAPKEVEPVATDELFGKEALASEYHLSERNALIVFALILVGLLFSLLSRRPVERVFDSRERAKRSISTFLREPTETLLSPLRAELEEVFGDRAREVLSLIDRALYSAERDPKLMESIRQALGKLKFLLLVLCPLSFAVSLSSADEGVLKQGRELFQRGKAKEAQSIFEKIAPEPSALMNYNIGVAALRAGRRGVAVQRLRIAANRYPLNPQIVERLLEARSTAHPFHPVVRTPYSIDLFRGLFCIGAALTVLLLKRTALAWGGVLLMFASSPFLIAGEYYRASLGLRSPVVIPLIEGTQILSAPEAGSQVIELGREGSELPVLEEREDWILVRLPSGRSGWVKDDGKAIGVSS